MSDHELSCCLDELVENNKQVIKKTCRIENIMVKKENRVLGIAFLVSLIVYLVPKLLEMVI